MLILGPEMVHLPKIGHNKNFPQKMDSANFLCLLSSDLIQKIKEKTNPSIHRKWCYRGMDRWKTMDGQTKRTEFIGPSITANIYILQTFTRNKCENIGCFWCLQVNKTFNMYFKTIGKITRVKWLLTVVI